MRFVTACLFAATFVAGNNISALQPANAETKTAIFAGGCFWCIEKDFEQVEGVSGVVSGYTGGTSDNPTYKNHIAAMHIEAVKISYDPAVVTYDKLLDSFWRTVDPTDDGGQFCDRGHSYTTAIFTADDSQKQQATKSKAELMASGVLKSAIVTPIRDAVPFYLSEDYHQDYYKKNPRRYGVYRWSCGRNQKVKALWGAQAYKGIPGKH